jgi:hypothetical protein
MLETLCIVLGVMSISTFALQHMYVLLKTQLNTEPNKKKDMWSGMRSQVQSSTEVVWPALLKIQSHTKVVRYMVSSPKLC